MDSDIKLVIDNFETLNHGIENSNSRTRFLFYSITLGSILLFVASFNAYLAWDRKLNTKDRLMLAFELNLVPRELIDNQSQSMLKEMLLKCTNDKINPAEIVLKLQNESNNNNDFGIKSKEILNKYVDTLYRKNLILNQEHYFQYFYDRQLFTIPILGVKCFADDVYILGGRGLVILLIYDFFNLRRENRLLSKIENNFKILIEDFNADNGVFSTLSETNKKNIIEKIYFGCNQHFVFFNSYITEDYIKNSKINNSKNEIKYSENIIARWIFGIINYLPVIAILFAFSLEIWSAYMRWDFFTDSDKLELIFRYLFTLILTIVITLQCHITSLISKNSNYLLHNMGIEYNKFIEPKTK